MDEYFYMCDECGFVNIVPGNRLIYSADGVLEVKHIIQKTSETYECDQLVLLKEEYETW
ncbi:MAG: hypothetical protein J6F30_07865 [Cellulosilyticum sp.]|nr:hypothetical protein [Cellulosilyticum sp.]